jgi:hypothetical protein
VVAFILTITVAIASERLHKRAPFIMGSSLLAAIGYIILLTTRRASVSYLGTVFAAAGIYPATAIVLAWPANNVSGQTKRAIANAMQIFIGNVGAIIGTQIYRPTSAPRFYLGHAIALGYLFANVVVVGILWIVLKRQNSKKTSGKHDDRLKRISEDEFIGDEDPRWIFQT